MTTAEITTETTYRYFAHVNRMMLCQHDERYVEMDEDERTGYSYQEDWFDIEDEAIAFVKREMADYIADELGGKGYKVVRTRSGLDTINYVTGQVERYLVDEDGEILDYGDDPSTEHHYEGHCESSLPDEVRDKAMKVQVGYNAYLDYEADGYDSLADELAE